MTQETSKIDYTELHEAAKWDDTETCKELLEQGADIDAKDKDGHTIMDYAEYAGFMNIYELLLERGAKTAKRIKL